MNARQSLFAESAFGQIIAYYCPPLACDFLFIALRCVFLLFAFAFVLWYKSGVAHFIH
jgi:hypothetical protein